MHFLMRQNPFVQFEWPEALVLYRDREVGEGPNGAFHVVREISHIQGREFVSGSVVIFTKVIVVVFDGQYRGIPFFPERRVVARGDSIRIENRRQVGLVDLVRLDEDIRDRFVRGMPGTAAGARVETQSRTAYAVPRDHVHVVDRDDIFPVLRHFVRIRLAAVQPLFFPGEKDEPKGPFERL